MNFVYAVTKNYQNKLLPSLRSLAEHHPDARVFVVTEGKKLDFETPIKTDVIDVTGQTYFPETGVNYFNAFTYINLLKVCYPSLMRVGKVIHLDADTIICDQLDEMWETDLKGKWFAAVPEYLGSYKPFGERYWNLGVAVINLSQMRKDKIQPVMVEYLNTVRQPWADQDAWIKFGIEQDKITDLPVRYNESRMTGETDNPAIVHYCAVRDWYENPTIHRAEFLKKYKER